MEQNGAPGVRRGMSAGDRALGMDRPIARRDFLNGIAVTAGALLSARTLLGADTPPADPEKAADYYPPELTGMRGDHDGIFRIPHSIRDGEFRLDPAAVTDAGEEYDLIIVGGGISGLAAAHFYRAAAGPGSRILILDNHDDFGGHAKRNEFHQAGRMMLGYGGTFAIESPAPYSAAAKGLIAELGIDV